MIEHGSQKTRSVVAWLCALLLTTGAEVVFYPWIATTLFRIFTGHGWDGSGLIYYQAFRVTPAGLLFGIAAVAIVLRMRNSSTLSAAGWSLVAGNSLLLVLSIVHYYAVISGRMRG